MEKYEEGIRRAAAHSIKDLNLGSKTFSTESRNDQHLHRHNQVLFSTSALPVIGSRMETNEVR
jgi:hypothetical protein